MNPNDRDKLGGKRSGPRHVTAKKVHWDSGGFGNCGGNTHGSHREITTIPSEVTCERCKEQFGTAMKYHGVTPDRSVATLRGLLASLPDDATWDSPNYAVGVRFYDAEGTQIAAIDPYDGITRYTIVKDDDA